MPKNLKSGITGRDFGKLKSAWALSKCCASRSAAHSVMTCIAFNIFFERSYVTALHLHNLCGSLNCNSRPSVSLVVATDLCIDEENVFYMQTTP